MGYFKPANYIEKKLQIRVDSVDAYFALSKEDREWKGLYKVPYALPWERFKPDGDGWEAFYSKIKKQYPVQYFFRKWLVGLDNPVVLYFCQWVKWPLRDLYYNVVRFFNPVFPRWRKVLPRQSSADCTWLVVQSNFALIQDFYWEEVVDGIVDWSSTPEHSQFHKELQDAVEWIESGRFELELKIENAYKRVSQERTSTWRMSDYETTYAEVNSLEQQMTQKQTDILTWFINNREYFWT